MVMAKKKSQQSKIRTASRWSYLSALVDRKVVVTTIVIALLGFLYTTLTEGGGQLLDRSERRKTIYQEIRHRVPAARQRVVGDVNLAKKYLDGVDRRVCLHQELVGVSLRTLLNDWESAGGKEIDLNIKRLAAEPTLTQDQMQRLLTLLDDSFPELEPQTKSVLPDSGDKTLPPGLKPGINSGSSKR